MTDLRAAADIGALSPNESPDGKGLQPFRYRPLALVGLMGVGKTTVGRRLAKVMSRNFRDSDEEIERASGRTVAGYFRDHGEAAFRDGERRVVARLLEESALVLATGGGAFIHPPTRKLLLERALVIWLQGDFETIMERVSRKNTRPLLHVPDPRARMRALMIEREPLYAQAHITVPVSKGPHMRTVGRIEKALDMFLSAEGKPA
ncbi:shikimate kinase [uncultured Algimonas sp.]|uniref:shikimate kinase n=1 Tax=uncultured Algimonas sp. TaxID=1547920 RepID=UPI0026340046|nr:shikimate kinase [uncultured Algimonas sp.]